MERHLLSSTVSSRHVSLFAGGNVSGRFPNLKLHRPARCFAEPQKYKELLVDLQSRPLDSVAEFVSKRRDEISLEFLFWLSDQEASARDEEKEALSMLAGQLVAVREGLEPVSPEDLEKEMEKQTENWANGDEASGDGKGAIKQRKVSLLPLTQSGFDFIHKQMKKLEVDNAESRSRSTREVIGRKDVGEGGIDAPLHAADRILDLLLSLPGRLDRKEALPDAFTPPPPSTSDDHPPNSSDALEPENSDFNVDEMLDKIRMQGSPYQTDNGSGEEVDYLHTTPFQLLRVIDGRLKETMGKLTANANAGLLPPLRRDGGLGALRELREDVLEYMENNSEYE